MQQPAHLEESKSTAFNTLADYQQQTSSAFPMGRAEKKAEKADVQFSPCCSGKYKNVNNYCHFSRWRFGHWTAPKNQPIAFQNWPFLISICTTSCQPASNKTGLWNLISKVQKKTNKILNTTIFSYLKIVFLFTSKQIVVLKRIAQLWFIFTYFENDFK